MLYTILKHYRKQRQKKYGVVYDSEAYANVKKNYSSLMVFPEMFVGNHMVNKLQS
jgi:glutaredoxin-related protein